MDYIPLRLRTNYSLLSSLIDIKKLISKAKELNYTSLCITDINNMYAVMTFYKECIKNNIKPLIAVEFTYNNSAIILLAKTYIGYKNLVKLTTVISKEPLTINHLENFKEDLILILPKEYISIYEELSNIYITNYIGYSNIEEKPTLPVNRIYLNKIIALTKEDVNYIKYSYKIKEEVTIHDITDLDSNNYLLNKEEITPLIDGIDITNYKEIINACSITFPTYSLNLPNYTTEDSYEYLQALTIKGLNKRLNNKVSINYINRLKHELSVIKEMDFSNYFLIVFDFVTYAKKNNIMTGPGRGSAAGSLVSYVLGITNVDPLKYNLYFERFLNPKRISMPDIDIDFDSAKRDIVIDYVRDKYGVKNVSEIITFGTLAPRQVIRDIAKVLDISSIKVDQLSKITNPYLTLSQNYQDPKFKSLIDSSILTKKMFDICLHLEGLPRHTSIHAAGIIICKEPLDEYIPLKYENEKYIGAYTSEHLEEFGLLKMDFLGLKNLTMIDEIVSNINKTEGTNLDINKIDYNDNKVIEIFNKVDTLGIFQFESVGMKNFLRKLKINNFDEVIAAIALYRPGPMDNIPAFISRKEKKQKVTYITKELKPILSSTYGVIVYQEQIMQIASVMGGFDLAKADILRKAMSKKKEELILNSKKDFIEGCINNGYTNEIAIEVFNLILKFAAYGFNKAHSVSYAMIAYQIAYLKYYYPKYFYSQLFTLEQTSPIKLKGAILEARGNNINILRPNINKSCHIFGIEKEGIRFSLSSIKGVGYVTINNIMENAPYDSFTDVIRKNYGKAMTKKVVENLIYTGCFDIFGYNKKTLIENMDNIINYCALYTPGSLITIEEPLIVEYEEYDKEFLIEKEKELLGFYLTMHPVNKYKSISNINLDEIPNYFDKTIKLIAYIDKFRIIDTKTKKKMAFLTLSDDTASIDGVVFPTVLEKYNNFHRTNIVEVVGKVEKNINKYNLIINSIKVLE